jgi:hypothetical protein
MSPFISGGRQAKVLGMSRASVYYKPRPVSEADLKLMHRMDKPHMEFPFAGIRMTLCDPAPTRASSHQRRRTVGARQATSTDAGQSPYRRSDQPH